MILDLSRRLISFHKYPRYLVDIYIHVVLQRLWRFHGIILGKGIIWYGKPILSKVNGSSITIGEGCRICSRSNQTALGVNHPVILRTLQPGAKLEIGSGVRMSGTTICAAKCVTIGNRCVIGANVTIVDTDFHSLDPIIRSSLKDDMFASNKPVLLGDDVFIGGNSMILKGVKIGNGSIIGAGSIVSRSIPENTIVAGNPATPLNEVQSKKYQ